MLFSSFSFLFRCCASSIVKYDWQLAKKRRIKVSTCIKMLMERTDSFLIFAEKAQKSEDTLKQLSHEENNDNNNSNFSAGDSEVKVGNGLSLRSRLFSKKLNFGKKEKTKKEETKGEDFVQQVRSLTNSITSLKVSRTSIICFYL